MSNTRHFFVFVEKLLRGFNYNNYSIYTNDNIFTKLLWVASKIPKLAFRGEWI